MNKIKKIVVNPKAIKASGNILNNFLSVEYMNALMEISINLRNDSGRLNALKTTLTLSAEFVEKKLNAANEEGNVKQISSKELMKLDT